MKISVSVDGACRSNGQDNAIASIGVYFDRHTDHNLSQVLRILQPTNQKAELIAAIRGLEQSFIIANHMAIAEHLESKHTTSKNSEELLIELRCDSAYVVRGILEWTPVWKVNGYKKSRGGPVANAKLFQHLDELVTEAIPAMGWRVVLYHVPREENGQADAFANLAIDLKIQSGLRDPLLGSWIVSNMPSQHICHMRELNTLYAIGTGTVKLEILLPDQKTCRTIVLDDVLYAPGLLLNLFSMYNFEVSFGDGFISENGEVVAYAPRTDGLLVLQLANGPCTVWPPGTLANERPMLLASAWIASEGSESSDM